MDNPPAFPNSGAYGHTGVYLPEGGMTLRDWFAGQALIGMGAWCPCDERGTAPGDQEGVWKAKAEWAYGMADAMLEARKSKEEVNA